MKVKWFIEGVPDYLDKIPNFELEIDDCEFDFAETDLQIQEVIDNLIQDEFERTCWPYMVSKED